MNGQDPITIRNSTTSRIRDVHNNTILEIQSGTLTITYPDGNVETLQDFESIQLVCGSVFHPSMNAGNDPAMLIGVCEECRQPQSFFQSPTHGLCSREKGVYCDAQQCGKFLCPKHTVSSNSGNYCRHHARTHTITHIAGSILKTIFFESEWDYERTS